MEDGQESSGSVLSQINKASHDKIACQTFNTHLIYHYSLNPTRHLEEGSLASEMSGDDDSSGWQLTESDPGVFTYFVSPWFFIICR